MEAKEKKDEEAKGGNRLAHLREIELARQKLWKENHIFEADAEEDWKSKYDFDTKNKRKYLITFPYPYMNGRLHLGHAFSLSKAEFQSRYQRLLGKNVLFPFGFHCTGMPIAAAAKKVAKEFKEDPEIIKHAHEKIAKRKEEAEKKAKEQKKGKKDDNKEKEKGSYEVASANQVQKNDFYNDNKRSEKINMKGIKPKISNNDTKKNLKKFKINNEKNFVDINSDNEIINNIHSNRKNQMEIVNKIKKIMFSSQGKSIKRKNRNKRRQII